MSKFEEYKNSIEKRYGLKRLETTSEFQISPDRPITRSTHEEERLNHYKRKWGISALQLVGYEKPQEIPTMADVLRAKDVIEARGEQLFVVNSQGERFWVSVRY
jgi:hypothetical protein